MRTHQIIMATAILLVACGTEAEDDEGGFDLPKSIVTDANLLPGALIGLDADEVKAKLEGGGEGNFRTDASDDDSDDEESCYDKAFDALKITATGDRFKISGDVDFSECALDTYKESYPGADFSELNVSNITSYAFYVRCSGQDFSSLNGQGFSALNDLDECNNSDAVETLNESKIINKTEGKIIGATIGGQTGDYVINTHFESYFATRTTSGGACSGSNVDGLISWKNGCITTTRYVDVKSSSGFEGAETDGDNVGKSAYEKLVYKDLKEKADTTSPWYADGGFDITFHDWSGTVTFASATSEPIFELTKGSETVTGTVKDEDDSSTTTSMHMQPQISIKSIINSIR